MTTTTTSTTRVSFVPSICDAPAATTDRLVFIHVSLVKLTSWGVPAVLRKHLHIFSSRHTYRILFTYAYIQTYHVACSVLYCVGCWYSLDRSTLIQLLSGFNAKQCLLSPYVLGDNTCLSTGILNFGSSKCVINVSNDQYLPALCPLRLPHSFQKWRGGTTTFCTRAWVDNLHY